MDNFHNNLPKIKKMKASQMFDVLSCNYDKYKTILSNIVSIKQCNWKFCRKKCKSVYYCSKLCQKKDWHEHKDYCKLAKQRIYKMTLSKEKNRD